MRNREVLDISNLVMELRHEQNTYCIVASTIFLVYFAY